MEHRPELVAAALTVLRGFLVSPLEDRPPPTGFRHREWGDLIAASLVWLGLPDPCLAMGRTQAADPEREAQCDVVRVWARRLRRAICHDRAIDRSADAGRGACRAGRGRYAQARTERGRGGTAQHGRLGFGSASRFTVSKGRRITPRDGGWRTSRARLTKSCRRSMHPNLPRIAPRRRKGTLGVTVRIMRITRIF